MRRCILTLLTAALAASAAAADETATPPAGPDYFGLALHGGYVLREADGSLDCNPWGEALRLSFTGYITSDELGYDVVEDGEIRVILPGSWRNRERLRYGVLRSWNYWGDELDEGASHDADLIRWVCTRMGCPTAGEGAIRLHVEPGGDITMLDFNWRPRRDRPRTVHAGGKTGTLRLGHCPDLR